MAVFKCQTAQQYFHGLDVTKYQLILNKKCTSHNYRNILNGVRKVFCWSKCIYILLCPSNWKVLKGIPFPFNLQGVDSSSWDQDQTLWLNPFTPCYQTAPKHLKRTHLKSSIYFTFLVILLVNVSLSVKQHLSALHAKQNFRKFS